MFNPIEGFQRVEPGAGFDELNAGLPLAFNVFEIGDPLDVLPGGGASRSHLLSLRQRAQDARALFLPLSDELTEVRLEKQRADVRLAQLKLRRGEGGPDLDDDDRQVIEIRKTIARLEGELTRLTALELHRSASAHATASLLRSCEEWLRRGRPGGTVLVEAPVEVSDVLKKGERLPEAVERLRHRLRELDADRHRIESAPFPSADCKARMREEIEIIAARGAPSVDGLVEHFGNVAWPQEWVRIPLVAVTADKGTAVTGSASGELSDTLGFMIWLHKSAVIKALSDLIDQESDDAAALSQQDREVRLTEIGRDRLVIERQEAALVWRALAQGDAIEHRPDATPSAVLGVELQTRAA
jgi:hypothetical protein